ncbi:MAG: hypothetical protein M0P31_08490 [Solirubrobacteraceae bacterium]|nr:hypothetical protein [Solirubrobacteraceae bacterium]
MSTPTPLTIDEQEKMDERERQAFAYLAECARDRQQREPLAGAAADRWARIIGHLDRGAGA